MPDPKIDQPLSEPREVANFSSPDLDLHERDIDSDTPNHWGKIAPDEYSDFGLDPCALVVFRSSLTDETYAGHFYDVILAGDGFNEMLDSLDDVFPDKLKVRVDCFGVSNRTEIEASGLPDGSTEKKREHILGKLQEHGYDNVHTLWTKGGMVADVQIVGRGRDIEVKQYHHDEELEGF